MKYSQGNIGRIFVIRLEDSDPLPDTIEQFCRDHGLLRGICIMLGGIDSGGTLVVGPRDGEALPPIPIPLKLDGVHEVAAVGTIFPSQAGEPGLHMHATLGRGENSYTGCIRLGLECWLVTEVVILEITDNTAHRRMDAEAGFELLEP